VSKRCLVRASRPFALWLLVVLAGCGGGSPRRSRGDHSGQVRAASALVGATRVEVYRIDGREDPKTSKPLAPGDPNIDGYAILHRGEDRGEDFAARLAEVFSDEATYSDDHLACFWPGVAFCVHKGDERVDVVICLRCQNFYLGPPRGDERMLVTGSFAGTPGRQRLIRLAKDALPDDPDIQALE
jgi:hypothetical protein